MCVRGRADNGDRLPGGAGHGRGLHDMAVELAARGAGD